MMQPLNQLQPAMQMQNRSEEFHRVSGNTGAVGNQIRETGLRPEEIVQGISKPEENGTKAIGRDGKKNYDTFECQTCKNRKYKDGSDDPGVSFKTATRVSPEKAAAAVRSHEMEHVSREKAKAQREDREVVSQSVTYKTGVCPECGSPYVSGGTTRTVTKGKVDQMYGMGGAAEKGRYLDKTA